MEKEAKLGGLLTGLKLREVLLTEAAKGQMFLCRNMERCRSIVLQYTSATDQSQNITIIVLNTVFSFSV